MHVLTVLIKKTIPTGSSYKISRKKILQNVYFAVGVPSKTIFASIRLWYFNVHAQLWTNQRSFGLYLPAVWRHVGDSRGLPCCCWVTGRASHDTGDCTTKSHSKPVAKCGHCYLYLSQTSTRSRHGWPYAHWPPGFTGLQYNFVFWHRNGAHQYGRCCCQRNGGWSCAQNTPWRHSTQRHWQIAGKKSQVSTM